MLALRVQYVLRFFQSWVLNLDYVNEIFQDKEIHKILSNLQRNIKKKKELHLINLLAQIHSLDSCYWRKDGAKIHIQRGFTFNMGEAKGNNNNN